MFVTQGPALTGPKWIVNFPTKKHWRQPSRLEWIRAGLADLKATINTLGIKSIAIPPLGAGNGGLNWKEVRQEIELALSDIDGVDIVVYEPTSTYQNVTKRVGVEQLTPARAMIVEMVRRYSVLGFECSILEVQKLTYFFSAALQRLQFTDILRLKFVPDRYGPYSDQLRHTLEQLDGSYIHCEKRIADAGPFEPLWFEYTKEEKLALYLRSTPETKELLPALDHAASLIEGFESPLGMELLSTVHWLATQERVSLDVSALRAGVQRWPGGDKSAAERKNRIFTDKMLSVAANRIAQFA